MLIAFAVSFIGVLVIFGNYKFLRQRKALVVAFVFTIALAATGTFLLLHSDIENTQFLMVMFSPLMALIQLEIARALFLKARGHEIILYMGGFLPKRFEERFVTRMEKMITFLMTIIALGLAYLVVMLIS